MEFNYGDTVDRMKHWAKWTPCSYLHASSLILDQQKIIAEIFFMQPIAAYRACLCSIFKACISYCPYRFAIEVGIDSWNLNLLLYEHLSVTEQNFVLGFRYNYRGSTACIIIPGGIPNGTVEPSLTTTSKEQPCTRYITAKSSGPDWNSMTSM